MELCLSFLCGLLPLVVVASEGAGVKILEAHNWGIQNGFCEPVCATVGSTGETTGVTAKRESGTSLLNSVIQALSHCWFLFPREIPRASRYASDHSTICMYPPSTFV